MPGNLVSRSTVLRWILDYACKENHHNVISNILAHPDCVIDKQHVRLLCAFLHRDVSVGDTRSLRDCVRILDTVQEACPDAVPPILYTRLSMDLKKVILMKSMEEGRELQMLTDLHHYFPRLPNNQEHLSPYSMDRQRKIISDFRGFLLPLLRDKQKMMSYMREKYREDFGQRYMADLQELVQTYLRQIHGHLPQTALEKILHDGVTRYRPLATVCPDVGVLLRELAGKTELTESDLQGLLSQLSMPQSDQSPKSLLTNNEKLPVCHGQDITGHEKSPSYPRESESALWNEEEEERDGTGSISDIDSLSEYSFEMVPPSHTDDLELWDVFSDDDVSPLHDTDYLPAITRQLKPPVTQLCIVKLHHKSNHHERGKDYSIYN